MSGHEKEAEEQAALVARIRGRMPRYVHIPEHFGQGAIFFSWDRDLKKYVEIKPKEETENEYRKPVRNTTNSAD